MVSGRQHGWRESCVPIHPGNRQLQHRCDGHPNEIGHLGNGDPSVMPPNRNGHPDDRSPYDKNICRGQRQVPHLKLNGREDQICQKVDRKRQGNDPCNFASARLHKNKSKRDDDDRIEDLPNQADGRRRWRPRRFPQAVVPLQPIHDTCPLKSVFLERRLTKS